jgi:hypothetical protein
VGQCLMAMTHTQSKLYTPQLWHLLCRTTTHK